MRNAARRTLGAHERWRTSAEEYEPDEDEYPSPPAAIKVAKGSKLLATNASPATRKTTSPHSSSPARPLPSTKLSPEPLALQQASLARPATCQVDVPHPSSPLSFNLTPTELEHHSPPPTMRLTDHGRAFQVDTTPEERPTYAPGDPRPCPPLPAPSPSSTLPTSPSFAHASSAASFKPPVSLPNFVAKLQGESADAEVKEREKAQKGQGWKKRVGAGKGRNKDNEDT